MVKNIIIALLLIALAVVQFHKASSKPTIAPTIAFKDPDPAVFGPNTDAHELQIYFGEAFVKEPSCRGVALVRDGADWTLMVYSDGGWNLIRTATGDEHGNSDVLGGEQNEIVDRPAAFNRATRVDWSGPAGQVCGIVKGTGGGGIDKRFSQQHP